MATTTAPKAQTYAQVVGSSGYGGSVKAVESQITISSAPSGGDIFEMVRVPEDCTVVDVVLITDTLDSGSGIVLDVGDGDDDDYYIAGDTTAQTGGVARMSTGNHPKTYSASDTIDITVDTAAGTFTSGDVTLVVYFLPNND